MPAGSGDLEWPESDRPTSPTSPLMHRTLTPPGRVPHPHADLPDARRLPGRDPAQAAHHLVHEQSGPQRPDRRRAGARHPLRVPPGDAPLSRRSAGSTLSASPTRASPSRTSRCCSRPWRRMLRDRTGMLSLSTASMRSIMDSIGSRLDEARDTGRYLVGLLVFLGLLGTFWGLLQTITSVGGTIDSHRHRRHRQRHAVLGFEGRPCRAAQGHGHGVLVLAVRPRRLADPGLPRAAGEPRAQPLLQRARGMAVGHHRADARRRQRLERSGQPPALDRHPAHAARGGGSVERARRAVDRRRHRGDAPTTSRSASLPRGVNQLVTQMRAEQKVVREWVDEQAAQQSELASALRELADQHAAPRR